MKSTLVPVFVFVLASVLQAQTTQSTSDPILGQCLVIESFNRGGRNITAVDPIEAAIVAGTWQAPKADESVTGFDGQSHKWQAIDAMANKSKLIKKTLKVKR